MPSNYLTLCCPLLLLPSVFPNIRVFSNLTDVNPQLYIFSLKLSHELQNSTSNFQLLISIYRWDKPRRRWHGAAVRRWRHQGKGVIWEPLRMLSSRGEGSSPATAPAHCSPKQTSSCRWRTSGNPCTSSWMTAALLSWLSRSSGPRSGLRQRQRERKDICMNLCLWLWGTGEGRALQVKTHGAMQIVSWNSQHSLSNEIHTILMLCFLQRMVHTRCLCFVQFHHKSPQFGFVFHGFMETAFTKVTNDIFIAKSKTCFPFDLSDCFCWGTMILENPPSPWLLTSTLHSPPPEAPPSPRGSNLSHLLSLFYVSLMPGVPNLWAMDWSLQSDQRQHQIRNKVHKKCNAFKSSPNHPSTPGLRKSCLPWNWSLLPKRLETTVPCDFSHSKVLRINSTLTNLSTPPAPRSKPPVDDCTPQRQHQPYPDTS